MFIVDSQVHLWAPESPARPWLSNARERMKLQGHYRESFTHEECVRLMDEAGVNRVIIVPPSWEGDRIDYGLEACDKHPGRFGVMARIPQKKPEEAKAMMRDWRSNPHIKGVRLTFHRPADREWMVDGTCDWFWPFAEEHDVKVMVHAPTWKKEIGAIAKRHPRLRIIVDHMGLISHTVDEGVESQVAATAELHVHPNIYVKVSSVPNYSTQPYPYQNIRNYVRMLVDKMGAQRCFWGTDITRLLNRGVSYTQAIEHFTRHMGFDEQELDWIMGRAMCECLDWPMS